eukprot:12684365-Heterocapsa_arctica.AAC.1
MTDDQNFEKEAESGTRPCGSPAREEIEQVCGTQPAGSPAQNEEPTEPPTPVKTKKPRAKAKPTITKEEIVLA